MARVWQLKKYIAYIAFQIGVDVLGFPIIWKNYVKVKEKIYEHSIYHR